MQQLVDVEASGCHLELVGRRCDLRRDVGGRGRRRFLDQRRRHGERPHEIGEVGRRLDHRDARLGDAFNVRAAPESVDDDAASLRGRLPELADLPTKYLHEPWKIPTEDQERLGVVIGKDYPAPIVDHKLESKRAKAYYKGEEEIG